MNEQEISGQEGAEEIVPCEVVETENKKNVIATLGLWLSIGLGVLGVLITIGILGLTMFVIPLPGVGIIFLPIICQIPGIVLGIIGIIISKKRGGVGKKASIFSIVISIVDYVLCLLIACIPFFIMGGSIIASIIAYIIAIFALA